jgi:hypothetical protein
VGFVFNVRLFLKALDAPCVNFLFLSEDAIKDFKNENIVVRKGLGSPKMFAKCWIANSQLEEDDIQRRDMWVIDCGCLICLLLFHDSSSIVGSIVRMGK